MVSLLIVKVKRGWIAGQGITSRRKNSDGPVCLVGGKAMLCCQICPEADELARSVLFGPSVKPTKSIDRQVIKPLLIQTQTLFTVTHFWRKNELQVDASSRVSAKDSKTAKWPDVLALLLAAKPRLRILVEIFAREPRRPHIWLTERRQLSLE